MGGPGAAPVIEGVAPTVPGADQLAVVVAPFPQGPVHVRAPSRHGNEPLRGFMQGQLPPGGLHQSWAAGVHLVRPDLSIEWQQASIGFGHVL